MICTMAHCGMCGRCSEPWDDEPDPDPFFCIRCGVACELDNHEPFCSLACRNNYDGPTDDPDGPWSGGFAENH